MRASFYFFEYVVVFQKDPLIDKLPFVGLMGLWIIGARREKDAYNKKLPASFFPSRNLADNPQAPQPLLLLSSFASAKGVRFAVATAPAPFMRIIN